MSAPRRFAAVVVLTTVMAACAHGPNASTGSASPARAVTQPAPPDDPAAVAPPTHVVVPAPSLDDARAVALRWVASTGDLLAMGPIARNEFLRTRVASASASAMTTNLDSDLAKLADGLPIPAIELRLVETPLTVDASIDTATGQAHAQVWSVVVFGAKDLGAPRMAFRTSQLVLVVEGGEWKLASFTAVGGPTPVATDALPADWDSFAAVAGWQPATGGER